MNIKLFKDGNRLYITVDDPSESLEETLIRMIGNMTKIEGLQEDREVIPEVIPDTSHMQELRADVIKTPPVNTEKRQPQQQASIVQLKPEQPEEKPAGSMTDEELRQFLDKIRYTSEFAKAVRSRYNATGYLKRFIEIAPRETLLALATEMQEKQVKPK